MKVSSPGLRSPVPTPLQGGAAGDHWRTPRLPWGSVSSERISTIARPRPRGRSPQKSVPVTLRGAEGAEEWRRSQLNLFALPGTRHDFSGAQGSHQAQKRRGVEHPLLFSFCLLIIMFEILRELLSHLKQTAFSCRCLLSKSYVLKICHFHHKTSSEEYLRKLIQPHPAFSTDSC